MLLNRSFVRACALPAAAAVVLLTSGVASAHVTISPGEGAAGSFGVFTASVGHGCDGSPTTTITIQLPEQLLAITPTRNPLWDVEKVMEELAEPVTDAHGNEITERVSQVVYTAKDPLPDGYRDAFELQFQVPDVVGETLVFPVVQACEKGETAWVETAEEGAEEPEHPAPTVTVLPADEGGGHGGDEASAEEASAETEEAAPAAAETTSDEGDSNTLGYIGLIAGLLGLAAGAAALVQVRQKS
jgi:periplasmic copper chaperone A